MVDSTGELVRIANNMRIGRQALRKDIEAFEKIENSFIFQQFPQVARLKWWCEALLRVVENPSHGLFCGIERSEQLSLLLDQPPFPQRPRNSYVKR